MTLNTRPPGGPDHGPPYPRERLWTDCEDELKAARSEIERLRGLVDACAIYLKEDETPAQRIERERVDTEAVLKLLSKEKREVEQLRGLLEEQFWKPFLGNGL